MIVIFLNIICWIVTFICIYILLNPKTKILKNINLSPFKRRIFEKTENVDEIFKAGEKNIKKMSKKFNNNFDVMILNFNGSLNVGNIMRLSCIFGVNTFHIIGRKFYDARSCVGSDKYINIKVDKEIIKEMPDKSLIPKIDYNLFLKYLEEENLSPIFIEQGGESIINFNFNELNSLKRKSVFIFGNETNGIDKRLIRCCKKVEGFRILSIPQFGFLKSLNVSNCASIILWEHYKSNEKRKVI